MKRLYPALIFIPVLAVAMALTGCQSTKDNPDNPADSYTRDAKLIYQVLLTDQLFRQLSTECMRLYPESMADVYEVKRQWWQRNHIRIQQADQALSKIIQASAARRRSETESELIPEPNLSGLSLALSISDQAERQRDQLLTRFPGSEGCDQLLNRYAEGDRDIQQLPGWPEYRHRLAELSADYFPLIQHDVSPLLQSEDRSLRIAEKLAQKKLCRKANLTSVIRQWPREVYNADCGEFRQFLIRCIWSECSVLP
ncbi:hypothetical protein [Oceanospirillum sediminis]|uniref:Lipoprotein n=1 Tax=Oceanospirillum sediminis TaxID=2760088 RepID=A0A839IV12_9GAMM|nr:hypothetical protein [Oceanospirillum sediminis]MBB1488801.1 hypothetical protein [Oceanospirillum sediminis]